MDDNDYFKIQYVKVNKSEKKIIQFKNSNENCQSTILKRNSLTIQVLNNISFNSTLEHMYAQ